MVFVDVEAQQRTRAAHSTVLEARNLEYAYGPTPALNGVSLGVGFSDCVAIMGPSGSGKSTLLHCLAGILPPRRGEVWFQGERIDRLSEAERTRLRRTAFGFVFQFGQLLPELTAQENVALPLLLAGASSRDASPRADRWLAALGLADLGGRRPGELSGGQAQRVAIARALVHEPQVVFADEPTGALDSHTAVEVLAQLTTEVRRCGAALVVVTHDPVVAQQCDRTVSVIDGRLAAGRAPR
ncbi:MAG: ABC transporter ATP-binding protein [Actinomycetia bacterium]|nr:ABC transporter ATP-binding protein [Actinomycetes bacterium]